MSRFEFRDSAVQAGTLELFQPAGGLDRTPWHGREVQWRYHTRHQALKPDGSFALCHGHCRLPFGGQERAMLKIKHAHSADCVVAGIRWYKDRVDKVGSLLLGLYDDVGVLHHVGVTSPFTMAAREQLLQDLRPLRMKTFEAHSWHEWARAVVGDEQRMPGARSRWSGAKNLDWQPLRPKLVCEVRYDHLHGRRFRHSTTFMRWRPDKPARDCRYDQLEVSMAYSLAKVLGI